MVLVVPLLGDRRVTIIIVLVLISVLASLPNIEAVWAAEDSWTTMSPMPTERFSFGVAVVNDKIFAIGGALATESGELTAANEEYDPATNTWTKRAPMPTPRYGCAATTYENMIYVFGGGTNESYTNKTEVYDPVTNTWETKTSMPTARILLQANVVGDKIYLIGGYDNLTLNEVYDPITDTWTTKTSIPTGVSAYASAVFDNKIYLIGGTSTNMTQIYDPKTDVWSTGASIPVGIWAAGACSIAGSESPKAIYVIGGETDVFSPQNLTQVYFPENNTWSFGASLPIPRSRLCTAVVDNMIYAIGGTRAVIHQGLTDNEQYTPFGYETIPEFPSWTPLLLVLGVVAVVLVVYKQKLCKTQIVGE